MKIVICDDNMQDIKHLEMMLRDTHSVSSYTNPQEMLVEIEANNESGDLYLLDIFMEEMNGIDVAKRIQKKDAQAQICFISTSEDFYREAYNLYALQYLIKPVKKEDMDKLLLHVTKQRKKLKEEKLYYKWRGEMGSISYGNILYINSMEHTLYIHCKDGEIQEYKGKLNELADRICGETFCRCHQSFIVNMYQVNSLRGMNLVIENEKIPISRKYYESVKKQYQEIIFEEMD